MKKHNITIEGKEVDYILTKTNRKTIGISIRAKEGVKVAAPRSTSQKQIEEVILKNGQWILEKLKALESQPAVKVEFKDEELFPYLGKEYKLRVVKSLGRSRNSVDKIGDYLNLHLKDTSEDCIRETLINWYREEATDLFNERLKYYSEKTGLVPLTVRVKDQKSRFGSCSSKKNINLNWKLIMAPVEVIDYVILHELCHLMEMNHSKKFWNLVESFMPDYQIRRQWLKEKGSYITLL